jgi:hypothetical protein
MRLRLFKFCLNGLKPYLNDISYIISFKDVFTAMSSKSNADGTKPRAPTCISFSNKAKVRMTSITVTGIFRGIFETKFENENASYGIFYTFFIMSLMMSAASRKSLTSFQRYKTFLPSQNKPDCLFLATLVSLTQCLQ